MYVHILIYTGLLVSFIACKSEAKQINHTLTIQDIAVDSALWIDVRSRSEYDSGHLAEAINIPYDEIAEKIKLVAQSKQQVIKLYCAVGGRSAIAAATLIDMGYFNVSNEGGYKAILKKRKQKKNY